MKFLKSLTALTFLMVSMRTSMADVQKISLDDISINRSNATSTLSFTVQDDILWNGKSHTVKLTDNDGMATLFALNFMATQSAANDLWRHRAKWEELKNKPIPNWNVLKQALIKACDRLETFAKSKYPKELGIKDIRAHLAKLDQATYSDLNELAAFLDEHARVHTYAAEGFSDTGSTSHIRLVGDNTENPIGAFFGVHPLALPPAAMSGWMGTFALDGDLQKLSTESIPTPAASEPVPSASATPSPHE